MPGLRSTSVAVERARAGRAAPDVSPSTDSVARAAAVFAPALAGRLGFALVGDLPPAVLAMEERRALEDLVARLGDPADEPPQENVASAGRATAEAR
jgi:hypothetical protein